MVKLASNLNSCGHTIEKLVVSADLDNVCMPHTEEKITLPFPHPKKKKKEEKKEKQNTISEIETKISYFYSEVWKFGAKYLAKIPEYSAKVVV